MSDYTIPPIYHEACPRLVTKIYLHEDTFQNDSPPDFDPQKRIIFADLLPTEQQLLIEYGIIEDETGVTTYLHAIDFTGLTNQAFTNKLQNKTLNFATLKNACLASADLNGISLMSASLEGADCTEANFHSARMDSIKAKGACFQRANFGKAMMHMADLSGADLQHAKIVSANIAGSDFREADLRNAILSNTSLKDMIVNSNTQFTGAIFHDVGVDDILALSHKGADLTDTYCYLLPTECKRAEELEQLGIITCRDPLDCMAHDAKLIEAIKRYVPKHGSGLYSLAMYETGDHIQRCEG